MGDALVRHPSAAGQDLLDTFARSIAPANKPGKHIGIGGLASRDDLMTQFVQMGAPGLLHPERTSHF